MKKSIKILLVIIISVSLILAVYILRLGGGAVKLEEGQMHMIFTEDGELTMSGYIEDKDLEDDFEIDFDDDVDDIIDDMQDYMEDSLEELAKMMDLDLEIEITELKKKGDFALVTMVFSDFELMFMGGWYEKFEDLADDMGDYKELAKEITFVTFKKGEEVDEDDLEDYEDGFTIMLDGSDEGIYYEFPGDILIVDNDMKYERISDTIIFVEDGEDGYVVADVEIDGEVFDPLTGMELGDTELEDIGDEEPNDTELEDIDDEESNDTELEDIDDEEPNDTDLEDIDDEEPNDTELEDIDNIDPNDIPEDYISQAGSPNDLQVSQSYTVYNADGSYSQTFKLDEFDYELDFKADFSASESEIHDDIIMYYAEAFNPITVDVTDVVKDSDSVLFKIITDDISSFDYYYGSTLEELASMDAGFEDLFQSTEFVDFDTRSPLSSVTELEQYGSNNATYINTYGTRGYITLPGDILVVDGKMTWVQIDSRTIYVNPWSYGIVVFED